MSLIKIGRYEILGELGRGAMGVVYKASDPTIDRHVAIKVLSLGWEGDDLPTSRDVFMREARAAGRLSHPHIVTIHDAAEDPETKACYIVMELVAGKTLEGLLHSEPPLTPPAALKFIQQVAEALEYAHRQQVVHRDLKPANILVTPEGWAKLTDFGIAKIVSRESTVRTTSIMGTPSYMSPEQVTGGEVDARSDLFSLGIILYQMLTRQKPFVGDTPAAMFKIVYEDPIVPSKLNPELCPAYDYLLLRCLSKGKDQRYSTARELLDDIQDILNGNPPRSEMRVHLEDLGTAEGTLIAGKVILPPPPLPAAGSAEGLFHSPAAPPFADAPGSSTASPKPRKKQTGGWIAMAVLVLSAAGILVAWNYRRREDVPPPPAPKTVTDVEKFSPEARAQLEAQTQTAQPPEVFPAVGRPPTRPARTGSRDDSENALPPGVAAPTTPATALNPTPASPQQAGAPPAPNPPAPAIAAASAPPRKIQVYLKHELRQGSITISNGSQVLLKDVLKGKKKGGLFGIHTTYEGALSQPLSLAAGIQDLMVSVTSTDGSVKLSKSISTAGANPPATTLNVQVSKDNLFLTWQAVPPSAK